MGTTTKKPNHLLRYHRENQGWSQQKLAELVDTSEDMVSRWERGVSKPSPFYREKLITLFGKNAEKLGFIEQTGIQFPVYESILAQHTTSTSDVIDVKGSIRVTNRFSFGTMETSWVVIDGDGIGEYIPKSIQTHFSSRPHELPEDLAKRREQIQKQQEENLKQGYPFQWNGERYSLDRFVLSREPVEEEMILNMWFRPSDYYTFLATNMSLDDNSLREKYLQGVDWYSPVKFFSNSFGIYLTLITSDQYTLLVRRGTMLGSRPGEYNISVCEGLSKSLDSYGQAPDVYRCASRGLMEEIGLDDRDDFVSSDITFLSFGVDTHYSQWGLTGLIKVNKVAEELVNYWNAGVKDKLENAQIFPVKFELNTIASFVFSHTPWAPAGLACLYHALIHEFGRKKVHETVNKHSL